MRYLINYRVVCPKSRQYVRGGELSLVAENSTKAIDEAMRFLNGDTSTILIDSVALVRDEHESVTYRIYKGE